MGVCAQNFKNEFNDEVDLHYIGKENIKEDDIRVLQRAFKQLDPENKGTIQYDINKIKARKVFLINYFLNNL